MSFEHAREMHSKYEALGVTEICVPLSIDASLSSLDVPEEFYPENHALFHELQSLTDDEESCALNDEYTNRLITATFGPHTPDLFNIGKFAVYSTDLGKGNPFSGAPTSESEREFETPIAGHNDLRDYIGELELDNPVERAWLASKEDDVRKFFIVSNFLLTLGLTVNFEINGDAHGSHQIGLRKEEDQFYIINSWATDEHGLLRKIGPMTLREVCGITEEPWSHRPTSWGPLLIEGSPPLFRSAASGSEFIVHLLPSENDSHTTI